MSDHPLAHLSAPERHEMTGWVNLPWPTCAPPPGKHWVYRAYDANYRLLYVGVTAVGRQRLSSHRLHSEWADRATTIRIEHFATRGEALGRERQLIRGLRPEFNMIYNGARGTVAEQEPPATEAEVLADRPEPQHVAMARAFTARLAVLGRPEEVEAQEARPWWLAEGEITVAMAADRLQVSTKTIRRAIVARELSAGQVSGHYWVIREEDFAAWLERHRVCPATFSEGYAGGLT